MADRNIFMDHQLTHSGTGVVCDCGWWSWSKHEKCPKEEGYSVAKAEKAVDEAWERNRTIYS